MHVYGIRLVCGLIISEAQGVLRTEFCRCWVEFRQLYKHVFSESDYYTTKHQCASMICTEMF